MVKYEWHSEHQNEFVIQPCSATCSHHHSHPCEKCGRQWGDVRPLRKRIADLLAQLAETSESMGDCDFCDIAKGYGKLTQERDTARADLRQLNRHFSNLLDRFSEVDSYDNCGDEIQGMIKVRDYFKAKAKEQS